LRGGNATTENVGLFDIQTDADLNQDFGGVHRLVNSGVLRKSAGTGSTDVSITFNNTGRLEAFAGTLFLNGVFENYNATTDILTGGTYHVRSALRFNSADVVTNNAGIVLDGATSQILDQTSGADLFGLRNFSVNGPQGDFTIKDRNLPPLSAPNLTNNGVLRGNATYVKNVTSSGTVAPGLSPGILTIQGNYTQTPAGTLEIEAGGTTVGTQFDRLVVTGAATLAGRLTGKLINGFEPVTGVGLDVLSAPAGRTGTFGVVDSVPFQMRRAEASAGTAQARADGITP
jgi:hypothetical protein